MSSQRSCRYFASTEGCLAGALCPFVHSASGPSPAVGNASGPSPAGGNASGPERPRSRPAPSSRARGRGRGRAHRPPVAKPVIKSLETRLANTTDPVERASLIRQMETKALSRKFASSFSKLDEQTFSFALIPVCLLPPLMQKSDPDFPFDLEEGFKIRLSVPATYPTTPSSIRLDENPEIPEAIRRGIVRSFAQKTERVRGMTLTQMMDWLDRESETLLSIKAQESKISFVQNASKSGPAPPRELNTFSTVYGEPREGVESSDDSSSSDQESVSSEEMVESAEALMQDLSLKAPREGVEIRLLGCTLKGISLLNCVSFSLLVKCARCKSPVDAKNVQAGASTTVHCAKCASEIGIKFTCTLCHENNRYSIGSVHMDGASPLDIQAYTFHPTCESCTKECRHNSVFRNFLRGPLRQNCEHCFHAMTLAIEGARFVGSPLASAGNTEMPVKRKRQKEVLPDAGLVVPGERLPKNGTCKHYGKSYRWFRFACCKKLYPCDICHESLSEPHEILPANRTVCGFCSKEQKITAESACTGCGKDMTKKTRAGGKHWEGTYCPSHSQCRRKGSEGQDENV